LNAIGVELAAKELLIKLFELKLDDGIEKFGCAVRLVLELGLENC
jgi:hypothetical protein